MQGSNDDATWALTSYLVANGIVLDDFGLAERGDRAQALFPDLPTIVHCLFSPLRNCNLPAVPTRVIQPERRYQPGQIRAAVGHAIRGAAH
jgi:hypothetical protein